MALITAKLQQHPVGQGGLMSGVIESSGQRFHWVYDCGSNQRGALTREIGRVGQSGPIDALFLSHLDSDHVNGIDQLLTQCEVNEVILPYLSDIDCMLISASELANGRSSGLLFTLLSDTAGWFESRGVKRITFVKPHDEQDGEGEGGEDGGAGPTLPGKPPEKGDRPGQISAVWSEEGQEFSGQDVLPTQRHQKINAQVMPKRAALWLNLFDPHPRNWMYHHRFMWVLAPYAHRPSDAKMRYFKRELERAFNHCDYRNQLGNLLRSVKTRETLRECYEVIWSDHNLVSMSLYAGPFWRSHWAGQEQSGIIRGKHKRFSQRVAWLGTGDMHLDRRKRREAFLRYYSDIAEQVNVFTLPHHGSCRNFHQEMIGKFAATTQFVAAAGPNSYGHPSEEVRGLIEADGREFVHVSDQGSSALCWEHWI